MTTPSTPPRDASARSSSVAEATLKQEFGALINPPRAAILAIGTTTRRPVVAEDGGPATADMMTPTLAADHRPVDGALAARWFAAPRKTIEKPVRPLI